MRLRPLALLTIAVLAAHGALLAWPAAQEVLRKARITGATPKELRFETRQINAALPAPAPAAPLPPTPSKPALRSQSAPKATDALKTLAQKAPTQQSPVSGAVVGPVFRPTDSDIDPATLPASATPSALDHLLDDASNSESSAAEAHTPSTAPAGAVTPAVASNATTPTAAEDDPPANTADSAAPATAEPTAPLGIGSAGYSAPLPPVRIPPSATLQFAAQGSAKGFQYSAKAQLRFKTDGLTYQAQQDVSAFLVGTRTQTSTGRVTAHGLAPQRFGDKARSERAAHLDPEKGRITYSGNDPEQPISTGAQDRLSIFLQLASMIAAGPERYPIGSIISIKVTSARAADVWTFVVEGPETLELPAGPRTTIRLARQAYKRYDQKAQLWLAPDMQYLPVRIRITQANGDFADLQLQSAIVDGAAPSAP